MPCGMLSNNLFKKMHIITSSLAGTIVSLHGTGHGTILRGTRDQSTIRQGGGAMAQLNHTMHVLHLTDAANGILSFSTST